VAEEILFELPDSPQEFGVVLEPSQLRRLDFSALDFDNMRRAGIEYIRTYFPEEFNDFVASNGLIMVLELVSFIGGVLSQREDILIDEAFLSTARTKEAVSQHLELINQDIRGATPAVVDVECTIGAPAPSEIRIAAGTRFSLTGPDRQALFYEVYRAPNDFTSAISIPPGKRGVVAYGIEGRFGSPVITTSSGGPNQFVDVTGTDVLLDPITITSRIGEETRLYTRVEVIEKSGPNDLVYEVEPLENGFRARFGDDVTGKAPLAGEELTTEYRVGGGIRGRIGTNFINESRPINPEPPSSASVEVLFRNANPSSGGTDDETLSQAKKRAPREFATQGNAVTGPDYALLASTFSHPVFGSVAKALGVMRSGTDVDEEQLVTEIQAASSVEAGVEILNANFINKNVVELYVLAEGPDGVVTPSTGLKQGLITFFSTINVLTDEVRALDGAVKTVDVEATVVVSRSADAGTVKKAVLDEITSFFDIRNFDMGEGLSVSNLYEVIQSVAGVKLVNIFQPADNIIPTKELGSPTDPGVGFNELITLGDVNLKFFFEQGSFSRSI
jgi:hypothetical protein